MIWRKVENSKSFVYKNIYGYRVEHGVKQKKIMIFAFIKLSTTVKQIDLKSFMVYNIVLINV